MTTGSSGTEIAAPVTVARTSTIPALVFAGGLALLAGATDVYGFVQLRGLYVSFMSGNTTMLGMSLGGGGFRRSAEIMLLIGLFVAGAAAGEALLSVAGRLRSAAVLLAVSILLCGPLVNPSWTAFALVSAMGALNAAMSRVGSTNVSLTYVTGALVKFGQGAGKWLAGSRAADLSWLLQAPMWASLLAGSVSAAMLQHLGVERPWPLPVVGLLLAICALWQRPNHSSDRDPQQLRANQVVE